MIFAHFGLAPSKGDNVKWKDLQDIVGAAEQTVCTEVCKENIQHIANVYRQDAREQLSGFEGTANEKEAKRASILQLKDGRIGIPVGMDGAW
jgi:hypothetical protein